MNQLHLHKQLQICLKVLKKSKLHAFNLHKENELTTLRMSHKVYEIAEQQKSFLQNLSTLKFPENKNTEDSDRTSKPSHSNASFS